VVMKDDVKMVKDKIIEGVVRLVKKKVMIVKEWMMGMVVEIV